MANLELIRWQKWAPDVGDNRDRKPGDQLLLELAVGMTKVQLQSLSASDPTPTKAAAGETAEARLARVEADDAALVAAWSTAWAPFARVKGEHTVGGQPVKSLADYLAAVPIHIAVDVGRELTRINSIGGNYELFSARSSGGLPTTGDRGA